MPYLSATVNGIDYLNLKAEFARLPLPEIDAIEVPFRPVTELGPLGEFALAYIANWTKRCIHACFVEPPPHTLMIEQVIACGADLVTLPRDVPATYFNTAALAGAIVGCALDVSERELPILHPSISFVYLSLEPDDTEAASAVTNVRHVRARYPDLALATRLPTKKHFWENQELPKVVDMMSFDYYAAPDAHGHLSHVRCLPAGPTQEKLAPAVPHGLVLERDRRLLEAVFEAVGKEPPPRIR